MDDEGIDAIGMLGGMFLILLAVWIVASIIIFSTSHVLDGWKWKCTTLSDGECVKYERKL